MTRLVAPTLALLLLLLTAAVAEPGDLRRGSIVPRVGPIVPHGPNIVPNPPPERLERHHAPHRPGHRALHGPHRDHDRHHGPRHHFGHGVRPGFVFISPPLVYAPPRQCVSEGYWAYHWVPTAYTQSVWVPGSWTADGVWVAGHYEHRAYSSGYYQPYWIPGQTYAC